MSEYSSRLTSPVVTYHTHSHRQRRGKYYDEPQNKTYGFFLGLTKSFLLLLFVCAKYLISSCFFLFIGFFIGLFSENFALIFILVFLLLHFDEWISIGTFLGFIYMKILPDIIFYSLLQSWGIPPQVIALFL